MFLVVFREWNTTNYHIFEISERQNNEDQLKSFIRQCKRMIGYNNVSYDSPMLNYFINLPKSKDYKTINKKMKRLNDVLFQNQKNDNSYNKGLSIQQIDLLRVNHYNNKSRSCSLKKLEVSMDYHTLDEYNSDFTNNVEDYNKIIEYCINDVNATYNFCEILLPKIVERQNIKKKTGINCLNWPDSTLGENLILAEIQEELMITRKDILNNRIFGKKTKLKSLIEPKIEFIETNHQALLNTLKQHYTIDKIEYEFLYKLLPITIAKGGIHGSLKGIFESNDDFIIIDADVSSLYPALIVHLNIFPEHIGNIFIQKFSKYYYDRLANKDKLNNKTLNLSKKEIDDLTLSINADKLKMNACYGKFNDVYSPLYDSDCTFKTTINGQLFILWWLEQFVKDIPDVVIIQANTDGVTLKFKRCYLDNYYKVCDNFSNFTGYKLEFVEYVRMAVRDVNNYCVVDIFGKIKTKGEYFYEKPSLKADNFHKSINFRISRKAAVNFLLFGNSYKETINNCTNIYDFIGSVKFKKTGKTASEGYFANDDDDKTTNILRFIYSKSGKVLRKRNVKNGEKAKSKAQITFKNKQLLECNKINNEQELLKKVNYDEYYKYAKDLIKNIMYKQLNAFE